MLNPYIIFCGDYFFTSLFLTWHQIQTISGHFEDISDKFPNEYTKQPKTVQIGNLGNNDSDFRVTIMTDGKSDSGLQSYYDKQ